MERDSISFVSCLYAVNLACLCTYNHPLFFIAKVKVKRIIICSKSDVHLMCCFFSLCKISTIISINKEKVNYFSYSDNFFSRKRRFDYLLGIFSQSRTHAHPQSSPARQLPQEKCRADIRRGPCVIEAILLRLYYHISCYRLSTCGELFEM